MITEEVLKRISKLSKISLADSKNLLKDVSNITDMIEELSKIDTEGVSPLYSVSEATLVMRADEEKKENEVEDLFKNIPEAEDNFAKEIKCFITPKVVE